MNGDFNCEKKIHPTQKPVELYKYLLNTFGKPFSNQKIFDSHLGSGSSRIAAYEYGFDFYACELSKTYFDKQEERFKKFTEQGLLNFGE
jgi:site-specific DNA-methyltransferase (adenine-specific)